jgi:hypothetical protein
MPIFGTSIIATFFVFGYQMRLRKTMKALSENSLFIYFINNGKTRFIFCFLLAKMNGLFLKERFSLCKNSKSEFNPMAS